MMTDDTLWLPAQTRSLQTTAEEGHGSTSRRGDDGTHTHAGVPRCRAPTRIRAGRADEWALAALTALGMYILLCMFILPCLLAPSHTMV